MVLAAVARWAPRVALAGTAPLFVAAVALWPRTIEAYPPRPRLPEPPPVTLTASPVTLQLPSPAPRRLNAVLVTSQAIPLNTPAELEAFARSI